MSEVPVRLQKGALIVSVKKSTEDILFANRRDKPRGRSICFDTGMQFLVLEAYRLFKAEKMPRLYDTYIVKLLSCDHGTIFEFSTERWAFEDSFGLVSSAPSKDG